MGLSSGENVISESPQSSLTGIARKGAAMANVHKIRLGITNVYLLAGAFGYLLIDAGPRARAPSFWRALHRRGIAPHQIRLAAITHVHFDHVGSLGAIQAACGCPILVHAAEADLLARAKVVLPPGTDRPTRMLMRLARQHPRIIERYFSFDPVAPDVVIDSPLDLMPFGFEARVIPTPGHTAGSLSVVTTSGLAFVGDLAVNYLPGGGSFWPPFGDSLSLVRHSWRTLTAMGVSTFCPAHGAPFESQKLPG
jgi:glyoxylase-like metal-dependent hydrolase (beta-lactamase superfamily II)